MKNYIPKLHNTVCISDNSILAAEISSLYRKRGYYFIVLDSPRMGRMDASNEVIRRNNVCARIKSEYILLTDLEDKAIVEFSKRIKSPPLVTITDKRDIESKLLNSKSKSRKIFSWGPQNLAIGLLKAKRSGMRLQIDLNKSPDEKFVNGENSHLIVFEERNDVAAIIAANYAFSIGAAFIQVPSITKEIVEEALESFYSIYSGNKGTLVTTEINNLRSSIRNLIPELKLTQVKCITFITNGMPWGFAFPELPTTHIFSYPDMGNIIANSISSSQKINKGTRVALMVDPGEANNSELEPVSKILSQQGTIVKKLYDKNATVLNVDKHIKVFPYDILFISTHAGEISGRRLTYKFKDSEDIIREIIVEQAVGFGVEPGNEMVNVLEYERFISLDGIPWNDSEKKKKYYIGSAIKDYATFKQKDEKRLNLINVENVDRVNGAMALRMFDNNLLTIGFHSVADGNTPIVFNNSCSSWKEMSNSFTFGGAIAYIGTLFQVTDFEAKELASNLFSKNKGRQLVFALWRAQKQTYDSLRHPYIMLGTHFIKIDPPKVKTDDYLLERLVKAKRVWQEKSKQGISDDVKLNSSGYAEFFEKQINLYYKYYQSINRH